MCLRMSAEGRKQKSPRTLPTPLPPTRAVRGRLPKGSSARATSRAPCGRRRLPTPPPSLGRSEPCPSGRTTTGRRTGARLAQEALARPWRTPATPLPRGLCSFPESNRFVTEYNSFVTGYNSVFAKQNRRPTQVHGVNAGYNSFMFASREFVRALNRLLSG